MVNQPKLKLGMTEIKLGLALSPAEAGIMKFGLDTDKKYRDVIFGGELFNPATAVQREIYDELVDDPSTLLNKAKAKVCASHGRSLWVRNPPRPPYDIPKYRE